MTKSLPFGRVPEYLATLTDAQKQRTACKVGRRLRQATTVRTFSTRLAMARSIRKDEKNAPRSDWTPVVKLSDGEGY